MSFFKKIFGRRKEKSVSDVEGNFNNKKIKETKSNKNSPQNDGLNTSIEEVKKNTESYINLGKSIYPIIRNAKDEGIKLTQNINPLIKRDIAEGIVACYVIDTGDKLERISQNHLKQFNLDAEIIHNTAIRNLINKVNENCDVKVYDLSHVNPEIKPFFGIEFDNSYNPSIMLLDDFWETTAKEITKSDLIAVSIPAKNIIFFSDFTLMKSFRAMRPMASQLFDSSIQDRIQLTKETYIRKDNKWIRFLNTDEQFIELMDY